MARIPFSPLTRRALPRKRRRVRAASAAATGGPELERAGPGQHAVRRPLYVRAPAIRGRGFCVGNWFGERRRPWSHDYPDGEVHFSRILEEISLLRVRTDGSNISSLDDPELFNYPVAYMAEPGFWA